MRRLRLVFLLGILPSALPAQDPTGVTLQAVLDATLAQNSQIRNEWLRAEGFRGLLLARNAPFDLQIQGTVQQDRDKKPLDVAGSQFALMEGTTYQVALARQLRSGITVSPTVQVTSTRSAIPGALATGNASAGLNVAVPLLYNRGGAVTTTAVRVAELDLEALRGNWRATVGTIVSAATNSYWGYVASLDRLAVQRDAEARAQRLLDETAQLVAKQERAPADLQPLRATVAARRGARMLAEQSVDEARVQLGILMGLDAPQVLTLGAPATAFPQPADTGLSSDGSVARLQKLARSLRPDLAAQRVSDRARALELEQYRSAQQPRLDLNLGVGYEGFTQGARYPHLLSPLYRNVPGVNVTVQLGYDFAFANSSARGQAMSIEASVEQQRLELRDIERVLVTDVGIAVLGVGRSATALRESDNAVALFRISVENEQRKLQLGMNTLFDVLNAEDALTNALLTAINNRRAYAAALVSLRLATGTAADVNTDVPRADAARLLTLP